MKISLIFLLMLGISISGYCQKYWPEDLVVVAHHLNFRSSPSVEGKVMAQFNSGEPLTFLDMVRDPSLDYFYGYDYSRSWIKVRWNRTGQEGYVFGQYVQPANAAYVPYQDCDRLQSGYWYGVIENERSYDIVRLFPEVKTSHDDYSFIVDTSGACDFILCSRESLPEGKRIKFLKSGGEDLRVGRVIDVFDIKESKDLRSKYSIICTGEYTYSPPSVSMRNLKVVFQEARIFPDRVEYSHQDLTDFFVNYGDNGIHLDMAADINDDNVPDFIFSEGDNRSGTIYYFLSHSDGSLEFQSVTWGYSKC